MGKLNLALVEPCLPEIAQGSAMYASANGTKPEEVALLCAIGLRETWMGTCPGYTPKGPDGSGDWCARTGHWLKEQGVQIVGNLPAGWVAPKKAGQVVPPPYAIPQDGKGWGRGIWQLDALGDVRDLIAPAPWAVDRQAAAACAMLHRARRELAEFAQHPLYERAVAARYNTSLARVKAGMDAGDPDVSTTGGDYGKDVLALRDALLAKYPDRLHREVA